MNSFSVRTSYRVRIESKEIRNAWLSCLDVRLQAKELAQTAHTRQGRFDPLEHVRFLLARGRIGSARSPLLVCGVRNVLSNCRCLAALPNDSASEPPSLYAVKGEDPLRSQRPYYAMSMSTTGGLSLEEYQPGASLQGVRWLFTGVPVLWDDWSEEELFQRIQTEAADQAHVYHLPRGSHPDADDRSRRAFEIMSKTFWEESHSPLNTAFTRLRVAAGDLGLRRERAYLHHIMGLDAMNNLVLHIGHGGLEQLGLQIKADFGVKRALCVENSGSVTLLYYPQGIEGTEISLVAAPNQRRCGTAFLTIELADAAFGVLEI